MTIARIPSLIAGLATICSPAVCQEAAVFQDAQAIKDWAGKEFFGGFWSKELVQGDKDVFVVVGSRTSGAQTSHIYVFVKADGAFQLILIRFPLAEPVHVVANRKNIVFRDPSGKDILVLPWQGIKPGLEWK